jgi:hypothetical protein
VQSAGDQADGTSAPAIEPAAVVGHWHEGGGISAGAWQSVPAAGGAGAVPGYHLHGAGQAVSGF